MHWLSARRRAPISSGQGEDCGADLDLTKQAADALVTYGALIVKDARVTDEENQRFLDLLEDYFAQPEEALKKDERPELGGHTF